VRKIVALFTKEVRVLLRDPQYLFIQLFMPGLVLVLFGTLFTVTLRRVPVAVNDLDGTAEARAALRELSTSPYFATAPTADPEGALARGAALGTVTVAEGFGRARATGRPELQVLIDGTNPAATAVQGYLAAFAADLATRGAPPTQRGLAPVATAVWYNPERRDAFFFVPGVMALLLFALPAIFCATSLVSEKENGTWANLGAAPVSDFQILVGKLAPYFAQAVVQSVAFFLVAVWVFGVPVRGSIALLAGGTLLFVTASIGLGGIFASMAATESGAWRLLQLFVLLPGLILSGFIYPLTSMPWVAQALSQLFPVRSYLELLRGVMLKGADAHDLAPQLLTLCGFAAGCFLLALTFLRRSRRVS
jgi:ABC-type multidrug transport system permease subunit